MKPLPRTSRALATCALLVDTAPSQTFVAQHNFSGISTANTSSSATNLTAVTVLRNGRLGDWLANHQ